MVEGIAIVAALVGLSGITIWWSRKMWRNEAPAPDADTVPDMWPHYWNERTWRANVRLQGLVLPLVAVPCLLAGVVMVVSPTGAAPQIVVALAIFPFAVGVLGAPFVWLFNRPKFLVAPHLRHQPGAILEKVGEQVKPTPTPRGSDPRLRGEFGPFAGAIMVAGFIGLVVWACTVALVPGLVSAVVAGAIALMRVRDKQRAGTLATRWEDRYSTSPRGWRLAVQSVLGIVWALGCVTLWESGAPAEVRAVALGSLAGACVVFGATSLWMIVDYRRRLKADPVDEPQ